MRVAISSQAEGKRKQYLEGSETRGLSSASNNGPHERPTPHVGEDIVRHSGETRRASINNWP